METARFYALHLQISRLQGMLTAKIELQATSKMLLSRHVDNWLKIQDDPIEEYYSSESWIGIIITILLFCRCISFDLAQSSAEEKAETKPTRNDSRNMAFLLFLMKNTPMQCTTFKWKHFHRMQTFSKRSSPFLTLVLVMSGLSYL